MKDMEDRLLFLEWERVQVLDIGCENYGVESLAKKSGPSLPG